MRRESGEAVEQEAEHGEVDEGLGAFWAALPHQIIRPEGQPQYYVVTLPLAWFLQCQLPAPLVDRLLAGQFLRESVGPRLELDVALFRQWEGDLPGAESEPGPAAKLELHARMLHFAATLPETPTRRNSRAVAGESHATKAEQMASYIARHYREPLAAEEVAGHVGLHPNYAMTLFKQTFRTTLNDYLIHYRISQAQRLLATTEEKIVDIAFDAGLRTFQPLLRCLPDGLRVFAQTLSAGTQNYGVSFSNSPVNFTTRARCCGAARGTRTCCPRAAGPRRSSWSRRGRCSGGRSRRRRRAVR